MPGTLNASSSAAGLPIAPAAFSDVDATSNVPRMPVSVAVTPLLDCGVGWPGVGGVVLAPPKASVAELAPMPIVSDQLAVLERRADEADREAVERQRAERGRGRRAAARRPATVSTATLPNERPGVDIWPAFDHAPRRPLVPARQRADRAADRVRDDVDELDLDLAVDEHLRGRDAGLGRDAVAPDAGPDLQRRRRRARVRRARAGEPDLVAVDADDRAGAAGGEHDVDVRRRDQRARAQRRAVERARELARAAPAERVSGQQRPDRREVDVEALGLGLVRRAAGCRGTSRPGTGPRPCCAGRAGRS